MFSSLSSIEIICSYHIKGKYPIPRKFKYVDKDGISQTMTVENIKLVETITPNGLYRISYWCESELDAIIISYRLVYHVKDMNWELIPNGLS